MLLSNRIKNIIKVAVLCTAVSLLSFYLGTKAHDIQQFKEINNSEASSQTHQNNQTSQNGQSSQGEEFFSEQNKYIAEEVRPILDVMEIIQNRFIREVDTSQLVDGAIKGMVSALKDRYSTYMKPSEFQEFINSLNGSLEGVGITIGIDENTGEIIVVSPIEGGPAHRAGILPKDKIIKVDETDLKGKSIDEAVNLLRGEKGTKVVLQIERAGVKERLQFELVRETVRLNTVKQEVLDSRIGYIKITSFDIHTSDEFRKAIDKLDKHNVKGLILDLRNNPGGSLHESVKVADQILGGGLIVYTVDRNKNKREEYYSDSQKVSLPLVVLINENSASAAEIVAGAVKDHGAGVLVGTKTFGKGSVQELEPLEDGSGIKLTVANYHIPSGRCIDGIGIEPNITVELGKNMNPLALKRQDDTQLKRALEMF
jgi:carboxyl-terminal processing protease